MSWDWSPGLGLVPRIGSPEANLKCSHGDYFGGELGMWEAKEECDSRGSPTEGGFSLSYPGVVGRMGTLQGLEASRLVSYSWTYRCWLRAALAGELTGSSGFLRCHPRTLQPEHSPADIHK
jgi:hypothetical protein